MRKRQGESDEGLVSSTKWNENELIAGNESASGPLSDGLLGSADLG
jgi:hypothetical protein